MSINYETFAFPKPKNKINKKTSIKKKSNKLAKLENNRFSIIQEKESCYLCSTTKNLDKHEAFGGRNRKKSMEYGLVYYLCRNCHTKVENDNNIKRCLQKNAKDIFIKKYNENIFFENFK